MILTWLFIIMQLSFAVFMLYLLLAFVTGAPYVPSVKKTAEQMIGLSEVTDKTVLYDLGSGDGRLLMLAAARGASAIGFEINPYLVYYSWLRAVVSPYRKQIHVYCKNLWSADLSKANVVCVYLLPWRMNKLAAKLKRELKPGSVVVTNSFLFPGWKIYRQDAAHHVYVYKI